MKRLNVLFLCTGNSCRSQMAEGWAKHLKGDVLNAYSAGIDTHGLNPMAVRVMKEVGIDISGHRSKHLDELNHIAFDIVITVCDSASESCPVFPRQTNVIHYGFDDPPTLTENLPDEVAIGVYRRVCDEIRAFVATLPEGLNVENNESEDL